MNLEFRMDYLLLVSFVECLGETLEGHQVQCEPQYLKILK